MSSFRSCDCCLSFISEVCQSRIQHSSTWLYFPVSINIPYHHPQLLRFCPKLQLATTISLIIIRITPSYQIYIIIIQLLYDHYYHYFHHNHHYYFSFSFYFLSSLTSSLFVQFQLSRRQKKKNTVNIALVNLNWCSCACYRPILILLVLLHTQSRE